MAQSRGQFPVLPGAVRNQEIQKPPFLARILLHEQPLGVLGQFEKAHAVIDVRLIGALMPLDVSQAALLLGSPLSGHLLEERGTDNAVEFIDVSCVNAVREPVMFGAQPFDGSLVLAPLVGMALVQGVAHPFEDLVVEGQAAEECAELLLKHLLANVWLVAFSLVAGAMVVDVTPLLDLPDHRATAVATGDQA